MTSHSRALVRTAVAEYFGGTNYVSEARAYRGAIPAVLFAAGLSTVRPYVPKRMSDYDYVAGQAAGRGMGASMEVELSRTRDTLLTPPGLPAGTSGGQRRLVYPVKLHFYHLAHEPYAEDAEADIDGLAEAVVEFIYADLTLGTGSVSPPLIYQAGANSTGIQTQIDESVKFREMIATHFTVTFDAEVQIVV